MYESLLYLRGRLRFDFDSRDDERGMMVCSRSSLIEERNEGIVRVNAEEHGGELVRLNENELEEFCRCF